MYEYDFHTIRYGGLTWRPTEDHREIVAERAAAGWRLCQMVVIPLSGSPGSLELIFERPARGPQDVAHADEPPAPYLNPGPPAQPH